MACTGRTTPARATSKQLASVAEVAFGEVPDEIEIIEAGLRFVAPLATGQKTGWFYDQTANRARLARYLPAGARVLDVCSYVGAWAVTALGHGAGSVTCVDSSETALAYVKRNAAANGMEVGTLQMDAFDALKQLHDQGERFDVVVVDPPAFIKRKKDIPQGTAAYRKLNQLAMNLIGRDGLLVSCSCSYHLSADDHLDLIQAAARHSARFAQVLEAGGQSPDHPVHPASPRNPLSEGVLLPGSRANERPRPRTPLNFASSTCTRTTSGITTSWLR